MAIIHKRSFGKPRKMFLTFKVYSSSVYFGVPDGSSGPLNCFLGVVDFGRLVPTIRESGTGLGIMSNNSSSSGITGDVGTAATPPSLSSSMRLYLYPDVFPISGSKRPGEPPGDWVVTGVWA